MVGVPGRSKGCSTCRRRKKKCDLKKPTCDACAKGKLVCGGYQREMIVIQVEAGKGAYKPQTKEVKRQVPIRLASMSDTRIRDLNRTALETHCFTAFWKLYGSKDEPIGNWGPETKIHKTATRLMQYTYQHVPDSDKLRCALLALSVSKLGRANKDQALIKRGMELYGKAVAKVAFEIKHRPAFDKMEMLVTCRLLALYEQSDTAKTSSQNWHGHVNGVLKIVRLVPPEVYAIGSNHSIFLDARYDGVVAALVNREGTFLSSPEWMETPFKGLQKTMVDRIVDVLVQLPEIIEEYDRIRIMERTPEITEQIRTLKRRCWKLDTELQNWYCNFTTQTSSACPPQHLQSIVQAFSLAPPEDLLDILGRYGLAPMYVLVQYWTACAILYSMMQLFYQMVPTTNLETARALSSPRMDTKTLTLCLARCVKQFLQPDFGMAAALSITLPVCCILQALYYWKLTCANQAVCPKYAEVQKIMDDIGTTAGGAWITCFLDNLILHATTKAGC